MTTGTAAAHNTTIELEYDLDEPPLKVWRAISIPEFRDVWLPQPMLTGSEALCVIPGQDISYRMRDSSPPFLESTVTFKMTPNATGGTRLQIIHQLDSAQRGRGAQAAANSNSPILMLAA